MWNELSGRQKGGLIGLAIVVALVAGYWIGRSGGGNPVQPMVSEPLDLGSGTNSPKSQTEPEKSDIVRVNVKGAVTNPGVYELRKGARVEDAIDAAGGGVDYADWESVNVAKILKDGDQVFLKSVPGVNKFDEIAWPVRINEAPLEVLELIPGIGSAMATDIVRWRTEEGPIEGEQDLERIPGFGPETVRRIAPYIRYD